jgi:hypothetical protein
VYNRVNLHSTASSAPSQFGYFNRSGIPDSHFHVAYDGTVEQYVDTSMRAFADLDGNDATISIETQGVAKDGNEPWRPAQVKAIIELVAWIVKTHGIPARAAQDSKIGASSRGISTHRLGIDGNFPTSGVQRGRLQRGGGMHYSRSRGKICPGYKRQEQTYEEVIPGVVALLTPEPAVEVPPFHTRWAMDWLHVTNVPGGEVLRVLGRGDQLWVRDGSGKKVGENWYVQTTAGNWVRSDLTAKVRPFHLREVVEETHVYTGPGTGMTDRLLPVGFEFTVWDGTGTEAADEEWYVQTTSGNWVRSAKTQKAG